MVKNSTFLMLCFAGFLSSAQENDTISLIPEITLDAYKKPQKYITTTKSAAVSSTLIQQQTGAERMLEGLNLLPGTRMEERSPGSYRLSVRGSTLRSPFGVRNIKVYLDDFIFSDAGGASYLNALDPELIARTEIYKGPEGGDFGAVTGGTAIFSSAERDNRQIKVEGGSYGLFKESLKYGSSKGAHDFQMFQSFSTSQSYREQSALKRTNFFIKDRWNYAPENQLNVMLFYSDLDYETPGGLTLAQMLSNRRQARPATATLPGAAAQDAGIKLNFLMAGLSHTMKLTPALSHFIAVQSAFAGVQNPFITNFEKRNESNYAVRTHFNFEQNPENWQLQTRIGFEGAYNSALIRNYNYRNMTIGTPQNFDEVKTVSGFVFLSQKAVFRERFFMDAALSYNMMAYRWKRSVPTSGSGEISFRNQLLPDVGVSWLVANGFSLRAKIGKGSSAPTLEEIRSSDQRINTCLQPEFGWNKEVGVRKQFGNLFFAEISAFDFRLKNAVVRQQDAGGNDYFVNAGGTVQRGVELLIESRKFTVNSPVLNSVRLMASGNLYDFTFTDYRKDGSDFSGNKIPGIAADNFQGVISAEFFSKIRIDFSNYYLPLFALNDANTVFSDVSWLANLSAEYRANLGKMDMSLYFRINNLYNTEHVLGYDLNAFGNRYYNPSPKRNYSFGATLNF